MKRVWIMVFSLIAAAGAAELDQRPAADDEWGYRPAEGTAVAVNPPNFAWRPTDGITRYELEVVGETSYRVADLSWNVHTPSRTLPPGAHTWRYRGVGADGQPTGWSIPRSFTIPATATAMPLPPKEELLARIPTEHPRLFVRPEQIPHLRELARGELKAEYDQLVGACDKLIAKPPRTAEPPTYPAGTERLSEAWRKIWWGNRTYTITALNGAATLAFTRLLGGQEEYGQLARRILLDCAKWDPKGATGYRYNDEAGMPYNYYFSRTYTFVNDLLSDDEKQICREVMKIRGDEMHHHLNPRHLWRPFSSHSNRAWHFLGEIGIAFQGEVEGADDWAWFATNVFFNVYPVWSDPDGGWHEGSSYWASYIDRFTWWADVMRVALEIDAYDKPYFSQIGYYPMYLMPPHKVGGGFGDLTAPRKAAQNVELVSNLAAQARNGHWQWYVEQMGGPAPEDGYIGFIRGALPAVEAVPPDELPGSRLFRGTGQAYLNSNLRDANEDVQVGFKSSPYGTQSHGYEANNSFLLWAYGQRLLIRSGRRDLYGSPHHRDWMWSTRSTNNITVGGAGQVKRSASSKGEITAFATTPPLDLVTGEAGAAYRTTPSAAEREQGITPRRILDRFTRTILFAKPDLVVVYDRLVAPEPKVYEFWLHAQNEIQGDEPGALQVVQEDVRCDLAFLAPAGLSLSQTNQYDPNPRERVKLREWHLTARTEARQTVEFVTVYLPRREGTTPLPTPSLETVDGGYILRAELRDGRLIALLPATGPVTVEGQTATDAVLAWRVDEAGQTIARVDG